MNDKGEPSEIKYLVPSTGHTLARRSDALVTRGMRDLEAMEQMDTSPRGPLVEASEMPWGGYFNQQMEVSLHRPLAETTKRRAKRILAVNDEETVRDIFSSMLTSAGYQCQAVAGGFEALALLESGEEFELILTDLLNSPMDGFSLLLRTKERFPDIPVVFVTAINDKGVVEECMRSGACEFLFMPFEREQLLATVSRVLKHRSNKSENGE